MAKKKWFSLEVEEFNFISRDSSLTAPRKRINEEHVQIFRISSILRVSIDVFFYHLSGSRDQRCAAYTRPSSRFNLIWFRLNKSRDFFLLSLIDLLCVVVLGEEMTLLFGNMTSEYIQSFMIFLHDWISSSFGCKTISLIREFHRPSPREIYSISADFSIPFVRYKRWL